MLIPNFALKKSHMTIYCCCLHKVNKLVETCFQMLSVKLTSRNEFEMDNFLMINYKYLFVLYIYKMLSLSKIDQYNS